MSNKKTAIKMLQSLLGRKFEDGSIICDELAEEIEEIIEFIEKNLT
jgi:hypothetical protein